MTRDEFVVLFREATEASVEFARRYVENELPSAVRFHVLLNQSSDKSHSTYPGDEGRELTCLAEKNAVNVLFRDGRCPAWIDVVVEAVSTRETRVRLRCCGRFVNSPQQMYYTRQGTGPFGIKGPNVPVDFKDRVKFPLPVVQPCG